MVSRPTSALYVQITRAFGMYWVELHDSREGKIGTSADYGPTFTLRGARRRACRILERENRHEFVEIVSGI